MSGQIKARLDMIRDRAKKAMPGPWVAEYSKEQGNCVIPHDARSTREAVAVTRLFHQQADAEFIAAARTDVPRMEAALRAVLELHKKAPIYDVMADDCLDHDYEMYGLELSMGDEVCSHQSHVDSYTCDECAGIAHNNLDGELPEWPCPTVRVVAGALGLEEDDDAD